MAPLDDSGSWPSVPLEAWNDTYATLHMWTQIVGKTRLALSPFENHWWNVALYTTSRGLTTSPVPFGSHTFTVDFDFVDHSLIIATTDGATRTLRLLPRSVADFYQEYTEQLASLGISVKLRPIPAEVERAIPSPRTKSTPPTRRKR